MRFTLLKSLGTSITTGALLVSLANAQPRTTVPDTVARIARTLPDPNDSAKTLIEVENTGDKAITALTVEHTFPGQRPLDVPASSSEGVLIKPGEKINLIVSHDWLVSQMKVAAVIFADGTYIGYSKPYDDPTPDFVTGVFTERRAEVAAWTRWQGVMKSLTGKDPRTALAEFSKMAHTETVEHSFGPGQEQAMGENTVLDFIQQQVDTAQRNIESHVWAEPWAWRYLVWFVDDRLQRTGNVVDGKLKVK
jgi:hypothetical protein